MRILSENVVGISTILVLLPLLGAGLNMFIRHRWVGIFMGLFSSLATLIITLLAFLSLDPSVKSFQLVDLYPWISSWGVNLGFGIDHLNGVFLLLTALISVVVILLSIKTVKEKISSYLSMILLLEGIVMGYFLSTNLLEFFLFYEAMLIPAFLLIHRWGGERSGYASMKFLLYTFGFSSFLFVGVIAVYFVSKSFDFSVLYSVRMPADLQVLLFLSFLLAFAVKIPIFPLHGWLRDTYYEAPIPVTIYLSAVLGKMGIYGLLRVLPAFPVALANLGPWVVLLCLFSFVYAACLALSERDIKTMLSYMSLSHVGIITAGAFTNTLYGFEGAALQSFNHGILSAALFSVALILYTRTGSFAIDGYGALAKRAPWLVFFTCAFIMAIGGFPGLNYFNGELLLLGGIFFMSKILGALAILGVGIGVTYKAWFFYRVFLRKPGAELSRFVSDLRKVELAVFWVLLVVTIYLGLKPGFLIGELQNFFASIGGGRS